MVKIGGNRVMVFEVGDLVVIARREDEARDFAYSCSGIPAFDAELIDPVPPVLRDRISKEAKVAGFRLPWLITAEEEEDG